jgi:alpha-1,3-mannosyl-glycoprotein beta-1,2-N-acetylglucosaminyltransferase
MTTILPLHSSSHSKTRVQTPKCFCYSRFNCTILFACVVFATWFILLYHSDFFNEKTIDEPNIEDLHLRYELEKKKNEVIPLEAVPDASKQIKTSPIKSAAVDDGIIPILVIAYERHAELKRCLDTLMKYIPQTGFQVYIGQDGFDEKVAAVAKSYGDRVKLFQRERKIEMPKKPIINVPSYYSLSQNYKFAINKVFTDNPDYKRIIILEEDIDVAPDFFSYFKRLAPLLDTDPTLLCISAWNDNGMRAFVSDATQLYRSDFFPGLGWMITRKLWEEELRDKWPLGFWDDWLREPANRRGRNCIRPEINRTYTFGAKGTSKGQFFNFLSSIRLNNENIDWSGIDLTYITDKKKYDEELDKMVQNAETINVHQLSQYENKKKDLKILYNNGKSYEQIAKKIGIMPELKAGVPRGAYRGVVIIKYQGNRLFLVPSHGKVEPLTYTNNGPFD